MDIDNILNTINKNLTKIDNYIDKIVTDILFIKVSDKSTQTECICCKICCPRRKNVHKKEVNNMSKTYGSDLTNSYFSSYKKIILFTKDI